MQRLNYQLKVYVRAVERIAIEKGLSHVVWKPTTGSIVRFELFEKGEKFPCSMWTIHHEHNRKKIIWSKEDYRKAADRLNVSIEYFITVLESI